MLSILRTLNRNFLDKRLVTALKITTIQRVNTVRIMEDQKKISSFFTPLRQKRQNEEATPDPKKTKLNNNVTTPDKNSKDEPSVSKAAEIGSPERENASPATSLTPEQKSKMDDNLFNAKMKRAEKSTGGLISNMGVSWFQALEPEFSKPYFVQLAEFVKKERATNTVFPPADEVFSWTNMGHIRDVKVVILGQDPYHGVGQAHGLCFSVKKGIYPPPSLCNMYKELESDIPGFKRPKHGTLTGWAEQGVLLLNACLTVKAHTANSHKDKGWEKFTDAVISWLNKNRSGIVFMLWGSYAQKKGGCIDEKKHHVLKGPHPSPLSAHRGYFGCKHFSQCNQLLKKQGKTPIDWKVLPAQD